MEVSQVAALAALGQKAVQEHYSFDRRNPRARAAVVQISLDYGKKSPGPVVKRERTLNDGAK